MEQRGEVHEVLVQMKLKTNRLAGTSACRTQAPSRQSERCERALPSIRSYLSLRVSRFVCVRARWKEEIER